MTDEVTAVVVPSDRDVPTEHVGTIAPNYYCRAWNSKRLKYCRLRAGAKTDHTGVGRCKHHGGNAPIVHGERRRYANVQTARIGELIKAHEEAPDPLNILPEMALVRALLEEYVSKARAETDAEMDVGIASEIAERLSRMAERYVAMNSRNAITYEQLKRFLFAAERKIEGRIRDAIADEDTVKRVVRQINQDLRGIRP